MVSTVRIREERLGSIGSPLDGTTQFSSGPYHCRLFRVYKDLGTETTANIGRDNS
jgi:hypothetical protein